ncbi:MAG TPA: hypothetical protein VH575_13705 [Gemmataceae bacterium]|jgi:hypothetical protein
MVNEREIDRLIESATEDGRRWAKKHAVTEQLAALDKAEEECDLTSFDQFCEAISWPGDPEEFFAAYKIGRDEDKLPYLEGFATGALQVYHDEIKPRSRRTGLQGR